MNTWYTTNKAAIDKQSLNNNLQVGAWAIYVDLQRNIADANMKAPPAAGIKNDNATGYAAANICATATNSAFHTYAFAYDEGSGTANTFETTDFCYISAFMPPVGTFGSSFGLGIVNKTTAAKTPWLMWGVKTLTAGTVPA